MKPLLVLLLGFGAMAASAQKFEDTGALKVNLPWDWTGIIGTGQSLSVGDKPLLSTNQPFGNLKLSTGQLPWPVDAADASLALAPLVEPVGRIAPGYPSSWPENIYGETPHSAMANQLSAMVLDNLGREFVSVHSAVGESGQGMVFIRKDAVPKGVNGHAYEASMIETRAITRLARAAGKRYGIGAVVLTHGESDAGNTNYGAEMRQLWQDYNADLQRITGQTQKVRLMVSQQNSCSDHSASALAQWKIGVDYAEDCVCSGPKYQYPSGDGVHLTSEGYRQLGEKYAQVYYERVVLGKSWQPLQPMRVERDGGVITVHFHVPVAPLAWDERMETPHSSVEEWKAGRGFEVSKADGSKVKIASVEIAGAAVRIVCGADPGSGALVGYAMVGEKSRMKKPFPGTVRWGLLRDSDPFRGLNTGVQKPNYGVAFELRAP
jgi:hypothetical protein